MKKPMREINEYVDLNEWQVAGIQRGSLDRGGVHMSGSKSGSVPGTARRGDPAPKR